MSNEIQQAQVQEDFEITKNENGKFVRKAIYKPFSSVKPETREEKIKLMQLLNDENAATAVSEVIGATIHLSDVIFNPYTQIDEDTGEIEYGVLSYLIDPDGVAYVTSSKSVYHSLKNMFKVFGEPHYSEDEMLIIKFVKKNGAQHKYTDIQLVG